MRSCQGSWGYQEAAQYLRLPPSSPAHQGGMSPSRKEIQGSRLQNQPKAQKRAWHRFAFSVGAHGQGSRSCAFVHHQNLGTDVCFTTDFYCFCVSLHLTLQVIPCVPLGKSLLCLCPSSNGTPCTGTAPQRAPNCHRSGKPTSPGTSACFALPVAQAQ